MKRHVLFVLCLAGLISCLWAGEDEDIVTTDGFRIDVRTTMGGRMLHGTEKISSVAENETSGAKLTVDQKTAAGWTVANPSYNSTTVADGWHDFTLKEGTDSFDARMLIINTSDIVIHEGVLKGDETWTKDKLHIVRHWVRVPENITLTIAPQAVVKFCEDTGIQVDGTLNADGAVFTVIADNTIGREVDLDGASFSLGFTTYQIIGDGAISMDGCDNRFEAKEGDAEVTVDTGTFRFDVRTSIGGRMLHGTEKISSVAENETTGAKLTVDQKTAAGWTVANPSYNSTKVADGWHDFALKEGSASFDARMLVVNAPDIVIHEGALTKNETWAANKLHIVRHWVRIPENITLTIAPQAVVKFCEDTGLQVDGTLNADGSVFTVIADNAVGRVVDLDGASFSLGFTTYQIIGGGVISMNGCDNRYESKAGAAEVTVATDTFRFDLRSSVGGRMLVGEEYISPVAEEKNANAKLTVDGAPMTGWNVDSPWIDSTKLANSQWHVFALNEGKTTNEIDLLPMNRNDVVVHEGVLEENQTWEAEKLHIVRHWVRVPKDITLTVEAKAVVKFCEDTGILVDEGGKLVGGAKAVFTSVMDDSDGDDTDANGRSAAMGYGFYEIIGNTEDVQLSDCIKRGLASLIEDTVWEDVVHVLGTLKVPSGVTLTIRPGAVVKFATGASLVDEGGVISAEGALFTHLADDSEDAGGDTNGDGEATAPVHDAYTLPSGTAIASGLFDPDEEGKDSYGNEIRYITPKPYTGGTIPSGVTKTLAGNRVHKVTGDIIVNGTLRVMPGAIVKMDTGHSIIVQTGGVLEAIGNRAQPIVFTSIMDDAHGGDADKEDNTAQPGDWGTLLLNGGNGEFEFCSFLYGGGVAGNEYNASAIVFMWNYASGTFKNCIFAHSTTDGCFAQDSLFENCIFTDCDRGLVSHGYGRTYLKIVKNCIFYDNAHGAVGHGNTMNITNSVFYKNKEADVSNYGTTPNVAYCCAYSPNQTNIRNDYIRVPVTADVQGNICKDPLFTDAENGDFTLKAGSPCIDAGDGTVAPEFDYWGSPRMNVAKIADSGKPNADGVCPDIGIHEMPGVGGGAMPDLSVSDVAFESKAYRQGDVMTVTWHDVNDGDAAAIGPWRDVVSLVRKEEQVTYVVEAASVTVPATLKSGRSQSMSASFKLPALLPGEWQIQVAANQYRDVFEGEGGESNILLSEETFTVEMDGIPVGNSSLQVASDSQQTFMLTNGAANGAVLRLTAAKGTELSVTASAGRIPTEDDFHWRGVNVSDGQWIVEIPKGTAGDVFVTVANNGDSSANVSVQRSAASATIFGTDVSEVANGGMASVVIYGAGLDKAAAAELGTVPATNIHVLSSMELVASFDLTNMAIGDYQLTVTLEGGRVLTMDGALMVSQGAIGPKMMAGFSMPETLRPGRWYSGTITYRNDGDRDAIAPLLYLTGHDVTFLDTDDGFTEHAGHIVLAGLAGDGDPSVIRPGRTYTVNVKFRGTNANATSVGIHFTFLDPNEDPLEWKMLLGGDDEMFAKRKADLEADFGTPLGLLKAAYDVCGHCSQYGRPMLDVLSVMEKLAAKPDDVEYGYISGVMVSRDDGQALANCSLVVDGGENDVCYVKTDAGGRFCAWGVPVGRTVMFGGPEGFHYFADGEVALDSDQKSGVSVYRLAEDNSTPQKTHTIADYKLVKDSDGVVWMVWLADDVLYAALADDLGHTTVSLPSDVKWTGLQVVSLPSGGMRLFLRAYAERNSEEDDIKELLYSCIASIENEQIAFSDFKHYEASGLYTDLQISLGTDERLIGAWINRVGVDDPGLKMQYFDIDDEDWRSTILEQTEIETRAKKKQKKKINVPPVLSGSVNWEMDTEWNGPCQQKMEGGLSGKLKWDFAGWFIDVNISGTASSVSNCQYYWSDNFQNDCKIDLGQSTEEYFSFTGSGYFAKKLDAKALLSKLHLRTKQRKRRLYWTAEIDYGPTVSINFTRHAKHFRNGQTQTYWSGGFNLGGKGHGEIALNLKHKGNVKKYGASITLSVNGGGTWNLQTGELENATSTVYGSGQCTIFSITLSRKFVWGEEWSDWVVKYKLGGSIDWDEEEGTRGNEDELYDLDSDFPHDMIIACDSVSSTMILNTARILDSYSTVMESEVMENGQKNMLSSSALLPLSNAKTGCWVTREEVVSGYKDSRLLYFEVDTDGKLSDVKRLHNVRDDYVHGSIVPSELPNGDLAVIYNVSKLDYSGSIADYFDSLNTYQVYCVERRNGQWEEPYLVVSHDVKEIAACYDENNNVLRLAWLIEAEDGAQSVYTGAIRNKVLEDTQVLSRAPSSEYGKLSMLIDGEGKIRTSWVDLEDDTVTVKMAVWENNVWNLTQHVLLLNDNDEDELEEKQTRGLLDSVDFNDIIAKTRGTEKVKYEPCDYCKNFASILPSIPPRPDCECGCAKAGTEYIPTECKCNQNLNHDHVSGGASSSGGTHTVTIPADCDGKPKCSDCNCKEKGRVVTSSDPNEIVGVTGMGDPSTQRFVRPGDWLEYTVYFENKASADVPAQEIYIDMALNPAIVDMKSLTFGDVVFGSQTVDALNGRKADGTFSVTQKGTRYLVNGEATRDIQTGEIHWYMRSYDASAEENGFFPEDIYAGFLPPNDSTHRGEGHVTFRVKVKENAPDGAFINAEATIVFDANDPITTSPAWFNWVTTQENPVADNSTLRWDTSGDANGTTYVVNYWSGDPDPTAPGTTITFNSDTLTKGSWKIADGLAVGRWYWNVTKTNGDESSKTSTWSFDILATHSLTVNGGIGGGMYRTNTRVTAEANTVEGKIFTGWTAVGLDMSEAELSEKRLVFYMPDNDVTLTANYKSDTETQTLELLKGWNWVGFSVLPEDRSLDNVLGVDGFEVNDMVVYGNRVSHFFGDFWDDMDLEYGKMYKVKVAQNTTVAVEGQAGEVNALSVNTGWNWISPPAGKAVTPEDLELSGGFSVGDRIVKSNAAYATYWGDGIWLYDGDFRLEPGKGYKLKVANGGTLTFGGAEGGR